MSNYKTCKKCGERKELIRFARHGLSRDGRKNTCHKCNGFDKEKIKSVSERIKEYFDAQKQKEIKCR